VANQYGRWTGHSELRPYGAIDNKVVLAFALLAINEESKGKKPGPTVAQIIVRRPDGSPIGTFELDAVDAESLATAVSQISDNRYGPIERAAIEHLRGNL
jgi:hypothetical protein